MNEKEKKTYQTPEIIFETHIETHCGSPPPNPQEIELLPLE